MTKPTLKDFINDPDDAMIKGYYPDFMSVGAFMANTVSDFKGIYKRVFAVIWGEYYCGTILQITKTFLINLIKFLIFLAINLTAIPLFILWWVVFWQVMKLDYKNLQEIAPRLNKLL